MLNKNKLDIDKFISNIKEINNCIFVKWYKLNYNKFTVIDDIIDLILDDQETKEHYFYFVTKINLFLWGYEEVNTKIESVCEKILSDQKSLFEDEIEILNKYKEHTDEINYFNKLGMVPLTVFTTRENSRQNHLSMKNVSSQEFTMKDYVNAYLHSTKHNFPKDNMSQELVKNSAFGINEFHMLNYFITILNYANTLYCKLNSNILKKITNDNFDKKVEFMESEISEYSDEYEFHGCIDIVCKFLKILEFNEIAEVNDTKSTITRKY